MEDYSTHNYTTIMKDWTPITNIPSLCLNSPCNLILFSIVLSQLFLSCTPCLT